MIAAKNRIGQLQILQQPLQLAKQIGRHQRLETLEGLPKTRFTLRKTDHQRGQKLGLRCIHQPRRVACVLATQLATAKPVENHHRACDARRPQLIQRAERRFVGLTLVDQRQHLIVAGFGADIGHAEPRIRQFLQLGNRLLAQVAWQAIARDTLNFGQALADLFKDSQQPVGRQHQGVTIGEEYALHDQLLAATTDLVEHLRLIASTKLLLWRGNYPAKVQLFQEQPLVTGRISECASLGGRNTGSM